VEQIPQSIAEFAASTPQNPHNFNDCAVDDDDDGDDDDDDLAGKLLPIW